MSDNMKIILRDIELNSNENWTATREDFYDVDHQCEYLEEQACSEELEHAAIRNRPDWSDNIND